MLRRYDQALLSNRSRRKFSVGLTVQPEAAETTVLSKLVSDVQTGVTVDDNGVHGTLKKVTGWTQFSGDPELQNGNFLVLKFTAAAGATTTVEILGGQSGPVELDSDMNWVGRIANNNQKIKVVTTLGTETMEKILSLNGVELKQS